jgi:hypothetical protein
MQKLWVDLAMFGLNKDTSGGDPRAHRHEIGGAWGGYKKSNDGLASGMVAGTRVATGLGWRPVESIAEGDLVLTFDGGLQQVVSVTRGTLWNDPSACPESLWPLYIPAHVIGNAEPIVVLPELAVMVESDAADVVLDDPFALMMSSVLDGFRGIERIPPAGPVEVIQLVFEEDQVVFAAHGALIFCPRVQVLPLDEVLSGQPGGAGYRALSGADATLLINCMRADDIPQDDTTHCSNADLDRGWQAA